MSREAYILSDIENMGVMLGSGEYNQMERDIYQMTGVCNMLNRDDNEEGQPTRGSSSQDNEIRNKSEIKKNPNLFRHVIWWNKPKDLSRDK